jgi:hypothetical protein
MGDKADGKTRRGMNEVVVVVVVVMEGRCVEPEHSTSNKHAAACNNSTGNSNSGGDQHTAPLARPPAIAIATAPDVWPLPP